MMSGVRQENLQMLIGMCSCATHRAPLLHRPNPQDVALVAGRLLKAFPDWNVCAWEIFDGVYEQVGFEFVVGELVKVKVPHSTTEPRTSEWGWLGTVMGTPDIDRPFFFVTPLEPGTLRPVATLEHAGLPIDQAELIHARCSHCDTKLRRVVAVQVNAESFPHRDGELLCLGCVMSQNETTNARVRE